MDTPVQTTTTSAEYKANRKLCFRSPFRAQPFENVRIPGYKIVQTNKLSRLSRHLYVGKCSPQSTQKRNQVQSRTHKITTSALPVQCAKQVCALIPQTVLVLRGSGGINGLVDACRQRPPRGRATSLKILSFYAFSKTMMLAFEF